MAIKSFTNDYSGRKKDISIAYKIDPTNNQIQPVDLRFGQVSSFCAGAQKLIQRYMISLLTNLGSQPGYPDFGTDLIIKLLGTNKMNQQDFQHIFNLANWIVISEFRTFQRNNADFPQDEQLNTASLEDFSITDGRLHMTIKLLTMAGEDIDFILPLPVVR